METGAVEGKQKEAMMNATHATHDEQKALWNGVVGNAWVEAQTFLDPLFEPFEERLVDEVVAASARRVLDVGCGTGSTTVAIARRLGPEGVCVGVDLSQPMIAAAKARAQRDGVTASFVCADAAAHAFEAASFDMIVSRFGVMFFDDPVAAFQNLRRAARPDAPLRLIVWRSAADNPFMTTAERAAASIVPNLPARSPDGPGQFAFADPSRVRGILEASGWVAIDIAPMDVVRTFPAAELVPNMTRLGPLGRVFHELDEPTRKRVIDGVRSAFDPYVHDHEVRFEAACWMIGARSDRTRA
jgi:SAM-dependent methyltransferase